MFLRITFPVSCCDIAVLMVRLGTKNYLVEDTKDHFLAVDTWFCHHCGRADEC